MAPYRLMAAEWGSIASAAMAVIAAPVAILAWLLQWPPGVRIGAVLFAGASLFLLFESLRQVILHEQWRFIVTNKRIILITPDPQRHGLADAIYLKRGKIQVVDTNWSSSPVWGLFQSITGSRDVLLSLAGYEFQTKGAVVKGGLRFPDVAPSDIAKLEELIFG
ncbi:MAG: hypothetical protein JW900_06725 [Anaerolineae bacterium]|nr:hypothetical protein [Anaerolineae bacterium]